MAQEADEGEADKTSRTIQLASHSESSERDEGQSNISWFLACVEECGNCLNLSNRVCLDIAPFDRSVTVGS